MAAVLGGLQESDMRAALSALRSLSDQSTGSPSFIDAALEQLTRVVASDLTTLSICDLQRGTRRVVGRKGESLSEADRAAFDRHFREHPLVRFHSSHPGGPTQRISDCWEAKTFRNSALHADYYRRIGINYVMALPLRIDNACVISIVLNRSRSDFRDSERAVLDALRPPLAAIYRQVAACEDAGLMLGCIRQLAAEGGWQVMRIALDGRILDAPPAAFRLLERFFPEQFRALQTMLPASLFAWVAGRRNGAAGSLDSSKGQNFTLSRLGSKLVVHCVPDPDGFSASYLLMKGFRIEVRATHLSRLPLTQREREILAFVAAGKTNGEIAVILAISARTVQKHLEHIFLKLGVGSRTSAAVFALAAADDYAAIT